MVHRTNRNMHAPITAQLSVDNGETWQDFQADDVNLTWLDQNLFAVNFLAPEMDLSNLMTEGNRVGIKAPGFVEEPFFGQLGYQGEHYRIQIPQKRRKR